MSFSINPEFLKEEERCGFVVPEMMKRTWAALLKTLYEIDKLCKKHDINYFAHFGSLLGAIRHKGFIPWDDDIDLGMLRKDYMKFLSVAHELPKPFRVKSIYTQDDFSQYHAVVSNSRDEILKWDEKRNEEFFGCPFIVGIDIYPYDNIADDPNMRKLLELMYYIGYSLSSGYKDKRDTAEYMELYSQFKARTGFGVDISDPDFHNKVMRASDQIAMNQMNNKTREIDYFAHSAYMGTWKIMQSKWLSEFIRVPFENIEVSVPKYHHEVLTVLFKENYMTPINYGRGGSHEYPFYKTQEEYFKFIGAM